MTNKFDELTRKIAKAKNADGVKKVEPKKKVINSVGMRIVSEIIASTIVGLGIGYFIDQAFGTAPWFLLIFLMLGMSTAFYNIYRMALKEEQENNNDNSA